MHYTSMSSACAFGSVTISFGATQIVPQCACGAVATMKTPDGKLWCAPCLDEHNRNAMIAQAQAWLTAAFSACKKDQRPKLYRSLSVVFHPDAGGDERLMTALNQVRERFQ